MPTTKKAPVKKTEHKPAVHKKPALKHAPKPEVAKEHVKPVHIKPVEEITEPAAAVVEVKPVIKPLAHGKSIYAVGRRKTAVAQILLTTGDGTITVNQLPFAGYFMTEGLQYIVNQPIVSVGLEKQLNIKAKVHGGGINAQAESMRHAISRALVEMNAESRKVLKKQGFLMRDPRVKERKKPGLKRARRAPQFSKR